MAERPNQREIVGERLRAARKAKGLRQEDVAGAVGVSIAFVCDIEAGKRGIGDGRREAFAAAVNLPIADLTELDPATLAVVEARLVAAGGCLTALRIVRQMAGGAS